MRNIIKMIKRLFCRHEYRDEYMAICYAVRNGVEYMPYLRTCKKCGKQLLIVIQKEREG